MSLLRVEGIRIAQNEQQAADLKTRLQAIHVLAAVERAYWGMYAAWGELDVRLQQYENAADNLSMVREFGLFTKNSLSVKGKLFTSLKKLPEMDAFSLTWFRTGFINIYINGL